MAFVGKLQAVSAKMLVTLPGVLLEEKFFLFRIKFWVKIFFNKKNIRTFSKKIRNLKYLLSVRVSELFPQVLWHFSRRKMFLSKKINYQFFRELQLKVFGFVAKKSIASSEKVSSGLTKLHFFYPQTLRENKCFLWKKVRSIEITRPKQRKYGFLWEYFQRYCRKTIPVFWDKFWGSIFVKTNFFLSLFHRPVLRLRKQ